MATATSTEAKPRNRRAPRAAAPPPPVTPEVEENQADADAIGKAQQVHDTVKIASLRPALRELERAVTWVYARSQGDRNPDWPGVTVAIQTRGKTSTLCGWFREEAWENREGEKSHEITLTAEMLQREPLDTLATVVHETVHLWMHDVGEQGVSKGGRHNKKFKEEAETAGLVVDDPHNSRGYAYTSLSDDLRTAIEEDFKPDLATLGLFRLIKLKPTAEPTTIAFICDCEDDALVTLRVSKGKADQFSATCNVCSEEYRRKD